MADENNKPTRREIELLAYELYSARGAQPGRELDDWLEAERTLNKKAEARSTEPIKTTQIKAKTA
jgi:hypothetical protein